MRRRVLWLLAAALLASCGHSENQTEDTGGLAPDFRLETLSHGRFYLNQHRGKIVVIIFWTTFCNICKTEKLALDELYQALGPRGVIVAGVCADPENRSALRRVVDKLAISYPTLLDHGAQVTRKYMVRGFPTTTIIGPKGRLVLRQEGYGPLIMRQIRNKVERLLSDGVET